MITTDAVDNTYQSAMSRSLQCASAFRYTYDMRIYWLKL